MYIFIYIIHIYTYIYGDLLWGIVTRSGGWEVPESAVCRLERQESQWYHSVWVPRLGIRDTVVWVWVRGPEKMRWSIPVQAGRQGQKRVNSFLCLLFYLGPTLRIERCPTGLGRALCFTGSTNSNANPIQKCLCIHTQKSCWIWASCVPLRLTHWVNRHGLHVPGTSGYVSQAGVCWQRRRTLGCPCVWTKPVGRGERCGQAGQQDRAGCCRARSTLHERLCSHKLWNTAAVNLKHALLQPQCLPAGLSISEDRGRKQTSYKAVRGLGQGILVAQPDKTTTVMKSGQILGVSSK